MSSETFKLEPQIVRAGAGTGKTTRLTEEALTTLKGFKTAHNRYPRLIVCTFTRKAAGELKRRLYEKAGAEKNDELLTHIGSSSVHISTIHGILSLFLGSCEPGLFPAGPEGDSFVKSDRISRLTAGELLFNKYFSLLKRAPFPVLKEALEFYAKNKLIHTSLKMFTAEEMEKIKEEDQDFLLGKTNGGNPFLDRESFGEFFNKCNKEEPDCFDFKFFDRFFHDFQPLAEEFSKEFLKQKKQNGVMTVEDLELWTLDLLRRKPKSGKDFSKEWDYWFIDEYQDTSRIQERIIQEITGFKNVFCVGDPCQSIYLFRGADPEVFERRERWAGTEKLEMNYRSRELLIRFFNDFFPKEKGFPILKPPLEAKDKSTTEEMESGIPAIKKINAEATSHLRDKKAGATEQSKESVEVQSHQRDKDKPATEKTNAETPSHLRDKNTLSTEKSKENVETSLHSREKGTSVTKENMEIQSYLRDKNTAAIEKAEKSQASQSGPPKMEGISSAKESAPVEFIYYDGKDLCYSAIHRQVQKLLKEGNKPGDICILSVKNNDLADLGRFLKERGLPVAVHSSEGFFNSRVVTDALFLFKFLINPHDDENFLALLRTPYFRVSDETLSRLRREWKQPVHSASSVTSTSSVTPAKPIIPAKARTSSSHHRTHPDSPHSPSSTQNLSSPHSTHNPSFLPAASHRENREDVLSSERKNSSFWNFVREREANREAIGILNDCYKLRKKEGLLQAFERAVFDRGLADLTLLQDPSGVSESHLWRLLSRIHKRENPLDLFYSFMNKSLEDAGREPFSENLHFVRLMTIHSAKGLEFKNVIVFDLSKKIASAPQQECFFDWDRGRMAFSAPFKGRDQKKIKTYIQKRHREKEKRQEIKERDRLLYVALTRAKETVTFMIPTRKPVKDSWFERFDFLRNLPKLSSGWKGKEIYKRNGYYFSVENALPESSTSLTQTSLKEPAESPSPNSTPASKKSKTIIRKTAGDFVKDTTPVSEPNRPSAGFVLSREKNIFFKTCLGHYLHECLSLLTPHSLSSLQEKALQSGFSKEESERIYKALKWTAGLKDPDMKHFLKTGFAEQPFQWKKDPVILRGRTDLWGKKDGSLWVFDYKSSSGNEEALFRQLSFYSYVLEQIHRPKGIVMCGVYPLEQKVVRAEYSRKHRDQVSQWLARQT